MKKQALILLPLLIGALSGCKGSGSISEAERDFAKARNLKYVSNYSEKLGPETEIDIYELSRSLFKDSAINAKIITATYDEEYSGNLVTSYAAVNKYQLYEGYAQAFNRTLVDETYSKSTKTTNTKKTVMERVNYYDSNRKISFGAYSLNGNTYLDKDDLNGKTEEEVNQRLSQLYEGAMNTIFDSVGDCTFYEKKNGYIGYYEDISSGETDGIRYEIQNQIIFEFDSNYKIKKGTHLYNQLEDYDYKKGQKIDELKVVNYEHHVFEANYGDKKPSSLIIYEVQNKYAKPYFEDGQIYVDGITIDHDFEYRFKKSTPQNVHIEGFLFFNGYSSEPITFTPTIYTTRCLSMYDEDSLWEEVSGKFSIKNPANISYSENDLVYNMKNVEDALWFKVDCYLTDNVVKFKSGSVQIANRTTLEEYMNNLNWN